MKSNLYIIQDSVTGAFGSPFFASCDEQVSRDFEEMVVAGGVPNRYISDTVIFRIGEFVPDKINPVLTAYPVPQVVLRGDRFKSSVVGDSDA